MSVKETLGTVVGGALFIGGWAISAAFIGWGPRDPVVKHVFGDLPFYLDLVGIFAGFIVVIIGFLIGVGIGNLEKYKYSSFRAI